MTKRIRSLFIWLLVIYITFVIISVSIMIVNHDSFDAVFEIIGGAVFGLLCIVPGYFSVSDIKPKKKHADNGQN